MNTTRPHWRLVNFGSDWGRDKMATIFQTTFSKGFSWMKIYEFQYKFHWSLFLCAGQIAWCWSGNKPLSEPMVVILLMHIYTSLGLNELNWRALKYYSANNIHIFHLCGISKGIFEIPHIGSDNGLEPNRWQTIIHDDLIKWKHFPRYWPFVRGIHWWPVNSPHKGKWRGAFDVFFDLCLNKQLC